MSFLQIVVCCCVVLFGLIINSVNYHSCCNAYPLDDFSIVQQRLTQSLWPTKSEIQNVVETAEGYAEILNSTCYWPDIDYQDQSRALWKTITHLERTQTIVQATTTPYSSAYNDTHLLQSFHCALQVWLTRDFQNPNWWFNVIHVPDLTTQILLVAVDFVEKLEIQQVERISYRADWWIDDWGGGDNLSDMLRVQTQRSLATSNKTGVSQAFQALWSDVIIHNVTDNGVQVDYSYHFHGTQLMSGAYGSGWATTILNFHSLASGTQYDLSTEKLELFAKFLTEGDAWMTIGNRWEYHSIGRAIDRPNALRFDISTRSLQDFGSEQKNQHILEWTERLSGNSTASPLVGNRHFFTIDYHSHRRPDWVANLKMHSVRTIGTECDNGENLKGEHMGDGVLNVYSTNAQTGNQSEYFNYFPLLDWQGINGITTQYGIPLAKCGSGGSNLFKVINTEFVGGLSNGFYGHSSMDTASYNVTAKRSWFFHDYSILALTSNLTDESGHLVSTTLVSRLLNQTSSNALALQFSSGVETLKDGVYMFEASNVTWFNAGGIGYYLPPSKDRDKEKVRIELGAVSGNYDTIGPYESTVSGRMWTTWLDHGQGFDERISSYVILPNTSVPQMQSKIDHMQRHMRCVTNDEFVHGVSWLDRNFSAVTFWLPNTTYECTTENWNITMWVNQSALISVNESDTEFTVFASHPVHLRTSVALLINRKLSSPTQYCMPTGPATYVDLQLPTDNNYQGAPISVTCPKATTEKQGEPLDVDKNLSLLKELQRNKWKNKKSGVKHWIH